MTTPSTAAAGELAEPYQLGVGEVERLRGYLLQAANLELKGNPYIAHRKKQINALCDAAKAAALRTPAPSAQVGELDWSTVRSLLTHGASIQQDYVAEKYRDYEEYSARLDAAARERVEEFRAAQPPAAREDAIAAERERICKSLDAHADHVEQNALALTKYVGMEDEARCRLLATLNLREAAHAIRLTQKLDDLNRTISTASGAAREEG